MTVRRAMTLVAIAAVALILVGTPAISQTPKSGGSLTLTLREDLSQGFAVHETSTISSVWPTSQCSGV